MADSVYSVTFVLEVALSRGQFSARHVVCTSAVRYLCGDHPVRNIAWTFASLHAIADAVIGT
jgi:hypothetical protein